LRLPGGDPILPDHRNQSTHWAHAKSHQLVTEAMEMGSKVRRTKVGSLIRKSAALQALPQTWGADPFRLDLRDIIDDSRVDEFENAKELSFHLVGDTGGNRSHFHLADRFLHPQDVVAHHMAVDARKAPKVASFFHLGDVVYPNGEATEYQAQFYEPYRCYPAPIVAIPGNHDATPGHHSDESSLEGFVQHFCARSRTATDVPDEWRLTQIQPNVYFTLTTPVCTFVGLYTNAADDGELNAPGSNGEQVHWLERELEEAPKDLPLFVCTHHPPYTYDVVHGPSSKLQEVLDSCARKAGRWPTAVISGHAHSYQRFLRPHPSPSSSAPANSSNATIPYIVAGAGGYWMLEPVDVDGEAGGTGWPRPAHVEDEHNGFLRLTVSREHVKFDYFVVPHAWKKDLEDAAEQPEDEYLLSFQAP
jgi:hypothetical protein